MLLPAAGWPPPCGPVLQLPVLMEYAMAAGNPHSGLGGGGWWVARVKLGDGVRLKVPDDRGLDDRHAAAVGHGELAYGVRHRRPARHALCQPALHEPAHPIQGVANLLAEQRAADVDPLVARRPVAVCKHLIIHPPHMHPTKPPSPTDCHRPMWSLSYCCETRPAGTNRWLRSTPTRWAR